MSRKLKLLCVCLMTLGLSACAHVLTDPEVPLNDYCRIVKPIFYDSTKIADPELLRAVEDHNSQWACVCENDCPKP